MPATPQAAPDRLVPTPVQSIRVDDRVDLESCPYLKHHATAIWEYAVVGHVEQETPECVAIGYEGIDVVGYPTGTLLNVVIQCPESVPQSFRRTNK